jgi:dipeptidyl aminopeptidase/acylaminoacyl peptidase
MRRAYTTDPAPPFGESSSLLKRTALPVALLVCVQALPGQLPPPPNGLKEVKLTVSGKAEDMLGRGRVSPDGRSISFEDQLSVEAGGTGNLAIWDTRSGETIVVNKISNTVPWADGFAESSVWSPDGKELTYSWAVEGRRTTRELRVVNVGSGRHRVVFRTEEGATNLVPFSFSPDGRSVLVAIGTPAGAGTIRTADLVVVAIDDGRRKILRTFDGHQPMNAAYGPDGRDVAFDFQAEAGSPSRDIAAVTLATGAERRLVGDPAAHERLLGWLPDGHLLFTSTRQGPTDAWALRVSAGVPQRPPVLVRRDVGQLEPLGITRDGRAFVQRSTTVREIYIAELDPRTGRALRPAALLKAGHPPALRGEPAWSPDGLKIAYAERSTGIAQTVVVQTFATGATRVYRVPVENIDWMVWARDGRSLYFDGTDTRDKVQRTSRLDLESGRVEAASDPRRVVIGFSPDGRYLFEVGGGRGLSRRDVLAGTSETFGAGAPAISLSPDAQWIAYLINGPLSERTLAVRPVNGGPERRLLEKFAPGYPRLAWTPDSRYVIFNVNSEGLHRISIDGGAKESLDVGTGLGWIQEKSMNVDGRHLAFGVTGTTRDVWVWSDVVPRSKR